MIVACGEALIDMVPRTLPDGETVFLPCPGGSPYNTAIAIGRLGASAAFLGRLSTDFFGETLISRLRQNKVGTDLIVRSGETSTLAFVKLENGREPQYIFYTAGSADRSLTQADLPASLPQDTRCILFGSISLTLEPAASSIEALVRREGERGEDAPVISLDPNVRPFMIPCKAAYVSRFEGWAADATIAKISEADFDFIYPGLGLEKSLEKILSLGPRLAVTTVGAKGAVALLKRTDGTVLRVAAPVVDVPVVDTIGAGDTFHGAFLAWLELHGRMSRRAVSSLTENELYSALFFANKAASLVCSRRGAEPPTFAETEALA
ncbi:MAG: carbohydrate kinase [Spirochaetaceae bacterium]|nr:carbohydrate kinase [Spirochaetaceae bacterium]